jgi:UDP-glucose 4-epimerase
MKIFVTGGAGFIGRNIIKSLKDHKVRIYDNLSNTKFDKNTNFGNNIDFVEGDILDYEKLLASSQEYDVIIHLAAKISVQESLRNSTETMENNVKGTENILKCCVENKIKKVIFSSSAAIYGENENQFPISESSNSKPLSPYGESKKQAELIIKKITKEQNIIGIIFRIFNVYGEGQTKEYAGVITKFVENISKNESLKIFGNGNQSRDFISIIDVVKAFCQGLNSQKSGTYNVASGQKTTINELSKRMIKISKKELSIIHSEEKEGEIKHSLADISKIQQELDFGTKISLKEGLKDLIFSKNKSNI